jgi:hypothetical protein
MAVTLHARPSPIRTLMVRVCASVIPAEQSSRRVVGKPEVEVMVR